MKRYPASVVARRQRYHLIAPNAGERHHLQVVHWLAFPPRAASLHAFRLTSTQQNRNHETGMFCNLALRQRQAKPSTGCCLDPAWRSCSQFAAGGAFVVNIAAASKTINSTTDLVPSCIANPARQSHSETPAALIRRALSTMLLAMRMLTKSSSRPSSDTAPRWAAAASCIASRMRSA